MKSRLLLVLLLTFTLAAPTRGGILFGKKPPKPIPAERVPQLLFQVKNDGDENKRGSAVEELRQYDPKDFPEIVPVLIDVLQNDKKPYVRAETAQTLGKIRPMQPAIAAALEQALAKDSSMRVRLQARSSLIPYHWSGVHGEKREEPIVAQPQPRIQPRTVTTNEPPLADPVVPQSPRAPGAIPSPMTESPTIPVPTTAPPVKPAPGISPLPLGPADPEKPMKDGGGPDLPPQDH